MDYTRGDQYIVHEGTGHRMAQDTEAIPTEWPAEESNQIVWSLMEIINEAITLEPENSALTPATFSPDIPATYRVLYESLLAITDSRIPPITETDIDWLRLRIAAIEFELAAYAGLDLQYRGGGIIESFEDETDVDTVNSSGQYFDASNDLYINRDTQVTVSSSGEWIGSTSNYTFDGDDLTANTHDEHIRTSQLNGDFELEFALHSTGGGSIGFYPVSNDGNWADYSANNIGNIEYDAGSFFLQNTATEISVEYAGAVQATFGFVVGDVITLSRAGTAVSVKKNGLAQHTYSQASTGDFRIALGRRSVGGGIYRDVSWTLIGDAQAMDLMSSAFDCYAEQSSLDLHIWVEGLTEGDENTEVIGYISKDGNTWEEVTLVGISALSVGRHLAALDVDLSAQAAGITPRWRVAAAGNDVIKLHAVQLNWRAS